jgi:tRNA uridine 5-carboxymethylaminomethyl modification enzyme
MRCDNVDLRLAAKGHWHTVGVLSDNRWALLNRVRDELVRVEALLRETALRPQGWRDHGFTVKIDGILHRAFDPLSNPHIKAQNLERDSRASHDQPSPPGTPRYRWMLCDTPSPARCRHPPFPCGRESLLLQPALDYEQAIGPNSEERVRLARVRPLSIGAAKRMEVMTPKGVVALLRHAKRTYAAQSIPAGSV